MTKKTEKKKTRKKLNWLRLFIFVTLFFFIIGTGVAMGFLAGAVKNMPSPDALEVNPMVSSTLYDINGDEIMKLHGPENRQPVDIHDVPDHVLNAFIAIEDNRFYSHKGLDLYRIAGAMYNNFQGKPIQGASTITQQLARNAFLTLDQTMDRKIKEALYAIQLERTYSKDQILEMYLNYIFFGHNAYGIESAAQTYFGKSVKDLTLAEAALLAGIPKDQWNYSPYNNMENSIKRRNLVLDQMAENGYISHEEANVAKQEEVQLAGLKPVAEYPYPYFVDYVLADLLTRYPAEVVYGGGLKIYTTLDPKVQDASEEAFATILDPLYPTDGDEVLQAATVVMDPHTGYIKAMIGGRDHSGWLDFNRAWQAYRQPGSAIKPLTVYTPAIDLGYTAGTVVDDSPVEYGQWDGSVWAPLNYNRVFDGLTTVRDAVQRSVNVVAVKVLEDIGIDVGYAYAEKMGLTSLVPEGSKNDKGLAALSLGGLTKGVSVLDMTTAYATLANGGIRVEPLAILRVEDANGNILEENYPQREVVISEETAYIMTDMLKTVIYPVYGWGTGTNAQLPDRRPAAGKTGTTSDNVDAWFVGYTPELVSAVWMGYDQPKNMGGVFGGTYGAPIWKHIMTESLADEPIKDFNKPNNIVSATIDTKSGDLASQYTPAQYRINEIFIRGTEPRTVSNAFIQVEVCKEDPTKLYQPGCSCTPETKIFLDRPRVEPYEYKDPKTGRITIYHTRDMALAPPEEYCDISQQAEPVPGDTVVKIANGFFSQQHIIVPVGIESILYFVNQDDTDHHIIARELGLDVVIPANETVAVSLTPERTGIYRFYCAEHEDKAENGRIQVIEKPVIPPVETDEETEDESEE